MTKEDHLATTTAVQDIIKVIDPPLSERGIGYILLTKDLDKEDSGVCYQSSLDYEDAVLCLMELFNHISPSMMKNVLLRWHQVQTSGPERVQ